LPRTLVLLRHGRTAWNHARRVQGQLEVPLDSVGLAQAAAVAPVLAALVPSALWSSDLQRARSTVEPLASACSLPVRYDERLREFTFGVREGLTHAEYRDLDPDEFASFSRGDYDAVPSCERTADVAARTASALGDLVASLPPDGLGVAVSHGAAIRVAVGALLGWPAGLFHTLRGLDNCGWAVLREHPENAALQLVAYNRVVVTPD
jgi:glucosyl-3-phosphoglycerate phosphatase